MAEYFTQRTIFERGTERQNETAARPPLSAASMIQTFLVQASGGQGVLRWASSAKNTTSLDIGTPNLRGKRKFALYHAKTNNFFESRA